MSRFPLEGSKNSSFSKENESLDSISVTRYIKHSVTTGEIPSELEMVVDVKSGILDPDALMYGASAIVTCLRLAEKGGIGYSHENDGTKLNPIKGALPFRKAFLHSGESGEEDYEISDSTFDKMKNILSKHDTIDWDHPENGILRLAFNRFNRSYDELGQEDVLLDLVICFEILFVGKCITCGKPQPKCKEIKNRISQIINPRHPVNVKKEVEKAYRIRSAIVHEGQRFGASILRFYQTDSEFQIQNMWQFVLNIRDYARQCLLFYINKLNEPANRTANIKAKYIKENP